MKPKCLMQNEPADSFSVSAVLVKKPSQHRWAKVSWSLLGVIPGLTEAQLKTAERSGELLFLNLVTLQLYRQFCQSYYLNLTAKQPKIYLVCREVADALQPVVLTVDFDEAAAYMEAGELMFDAPLPVSLCIWLERFVLTHYQLEAPKKRQRQRWHKKPEGSA